MLFDVAGAESVAIAMHVYPIPYVRGRHATPPPPHVLRGEQNYKLETYLLL